MLWLQLQGPKQGLGGVAVNERGEEEEEEESTEHGDTAASATGVGLVAASCLYQKRSGLVRMEHSEAGRSWHHFVICCEGPLCLPFVIQA